MDYEKFRKKIKTEYDLVLIDNIRTSNEKIQQKAFEMYNNGDNLNKIVAFCDKEKNKILADKLKKEANLSKRFSTRTFENFIVENNIQKEAYDKSLKYAQNIDTYLEDGTGLIIAGNGDVGTGKTHLACAVANYLLDKGYPVKVINITKMIASIKEDFKVKPYIDVPILLIDDLGKENATSWVAETLYAIFNERYEAVKPTIITTENGIDTLKNNYKFITNGITQDRGKAIISRLLQDFIYIVLNGEDYRQRRAA